MNNDHYLLYSPIAVIRQAHTITGMIIIATLNSKFGSSSRPTKKGDSSFETERIKFKNKCTYFGQVSTVIESLISLNCNTSRF